MKSVLQINWLEFFSGFGWYVSDLIRYMGINGNKYSRVSFRNLRPYLGDKTSKTEIEPIYFLQDTWFAEKVFRENPQKHVDIGSNVKTVAIISKIIPTTFVDIRPPNIKVEGLKFIKGNVLNLPFADKSLESVSSICVLEHIGLGRYGDSIDPFGSEKSISEIKRVVKSQGNLFLTVPVDSENKAFFNAHRAFTREYFLFLFEGEFELKEEKYIYGKNLYPRYSIKRGFGTGLFHFVRK